MRLLRKLLIESLRLRPWATDTARPKKEELAELLTEAQRLAEAVGNEDERWRVRIPPLPLVCLPGGCPPQKEGAGRGAALGASGRLQAPQQCSGLNRGLL